MISENPTRDHLGGEMPRRRGRRKGSGPFTVEDCAKIEATPELLLSPGSPLSASPQPGDRPSVPLAGSWPDGTPISFTVEILTTVQHLGGVRLWFACPRCGRRCRFLLSPSPNRPFWCRQCWAVPYRSQYLNFTPEERFVLKFLREGSRMLEPKRRRRRRRRSPATPEEGQRGNGSTETPMQESGTPSLDHYRAAWGRFLRDLE